MKFVKKITAAIMASVMIFTAVPAAYAANLADYYTEYTIDQLIADTEPIKDGITYTGFMEKKYDKYWFRIDCRNAGTLTLNAEVGVSDWNMDLYDAAGDNLKAANFNVTTGKGKYEENNNLELDWDKNKNNTVVSASYKVRKGTYMVQLCSFQEDERVGKVMFTADFPKPAETSSSSSATAKKLIYAPFSEINKDFSYKQYLGKDLFYISTKSGNNCIYRIDDTVLKNWRKNGKLTAKKITVDKKITANKNWDVSQILSKGNYGVFRYKKDNVTYYNAVKYNSSKGTITVYYTSAKPFKVSQDGYVSQWERSSNDTKLTLSIYNNSGKKVKTLNFNVGENSWRYWFFTENEYCALSVGSYDEKKDKWSGLVYLIDHFGNYTTHTDYAVSEGQLRTNFFMMTNAESLVPTAVYSFDNKKTYNLSGKEMVGFTENGIDFYLSYLGDRLWGTKADAAYKDMTGMMTVYALTDVSTGKLISKKYYNMVTYDGKIFRVKNEKGQYGYIDANGKELGWFDDAAAFPVGSKYAPVTKNGKTYLIDRNMKKVSKNADLGRMPLVTSYGTETYTWTDIKDSYIMTFA